MNTINFIDSELKKLPAEEKRYRVEDSRNPGLTVRVTKTGRIVFYMRIKSGGKLIEENLGTFVKKGGGSVEIDCKEARRRFATVKATLGLLGANAKEQARERKTFDEVWRRYQEDNPDKVTANTLANRDKVYGKHIQGKIKTAKAPAKFGIGGKLMHTIDHVMVETILEQAGKIVGSRSQREVFDIIALTFRHACRWGYLVLDHRAPTRDVARPANSEKRKRRLGPDEVGPFIHAVLASAEYKEHNNMRSKKITGHRRTISDAIMVMLFTGVRSGNVKAMRWSEIEMDRARWTILTKNGETYTVPLDEYVMDIIRRRKFMGLDSEFVFPARKNKGIEGGHLGRIDQAFATIVDTAGIKHLTPHDLRRTQGSVQAGLGVNMGLVAQALCHKNIESTSTYVWASNEDELRTNFNRANRAMMAIAGYDVDEGGDSELTEADYMEIHEALLATGRNDLANKVQATMDVRRIA